MKCDACGAEVTSGSSFCSKCGARLGAAAEPGEMAGRLTPPDGHSRLLSAAVLPGDAAGKSAGDKSPTLGTGRRDDEEREIWVARYSPKAMIGEWIVTSLVAIGILVGGIYAGHWVYALLAIAVIAAIQLLRLAYKMLNDKYRLTSQRLLHETGILSRTVNRMELIDIEDVQMRRGPIERLLGLGAITMLTSDVSDKNMSMSGLDQVEQRFNELEKALRAEKRRREVRIEQTK